MRPGAIAAQYSRHPIPHLAGFFTAVTYALTHPHIMTAAILFPFVFCGLVALLAWRLIRDISRDYQLPDDEYQPTDYWPAAETSAGEPKPRPGRTTDFADAFAALFEGARIRPESATAAWVALDTSDDGRRIPYIYYPVDTRRVWVPRLSDFSKKWVILDE